MIVCNRVGPWTLEKWFLALGSLGVHTAATAVVEVGFCEGNAEAGNGGCGPEGMMRVEFYWRGLACPMDRHILLSFLGGA